MSDLKRNQLANLNKSLDHFPVVLILGVRQCGKSTLAKNARPDWKYFDLENSKDFSFISSDLDFFFKQFPANIIIDEAQELPQLFKHLRGVIDQNKEKNRFILTGSSSPELIRAASDSLAGRVAIIELGTLKMNELASNELPAFYSLFHREIDSSTIDHIEKLRATTTQVNSWRSFLYGGYPEPVLKQDKEFFESWMENYFKTYINLDLKKLFPKLNTQKFSRFVSILSELSGTILNKAQIGRSIDVNEVTVRDYLDIAHKTFFWRMIPSYEKTTSKSITKMPKGIFRDTGILNYLSYIDSHEKLLRSPNFGQNFESFVIEEIIKGFEASSLQRWNYYYYRTKNGVEVDLILDGSFGTLPIEIKSGSSTSMKDLKSLDYFIKQQNLPLGVVINNSEEIQKISEKIIQIPVTYI